MTDQKAKEGPTLTMGKIPIQSLSATSSTSMKRLTCMLWGLPGCGKTTLAATSPGKKLWLNLDPDGTTSIAACPEQILLADFSTAGPSVVETLAKSPNPMGLRSILTDEKIDTLVVDSITALSELALEQGIKGAGPSASIYKPTQQGYGQRNIYTIQCIKNLIRITSELGIHLIMVGHEGAPRTNADGAVIEVPLALGGQLPNLAPKDISEVWNLRDLGGERRISIRPSNLRAHCKTRMFETTGEREFSWAFNPDTWEGDGRIDKWYDMWREGGYKKIPLPSKPKSTKK